MALQVAPHVAIELPEFRFVTASNEPPDADHVLSELVRFAHESVRAFSALASPRATNTPLAAVGRIRGRGTAASFRRMIGALELARPLQLKYPFEGSDRVGGACWVVDSASLGEPPASAAKLRWESRALDLPMHVHDHSDRVIVVLEGRGYFHVSSRSADEFTSGDVRTVAAREMDVFLFRRGTVHTFSTLGSTMTLLSCQLPFLPFDDPRQYRLPALRWCASNLLGHEAFDAVCEPAWTVLASGDVPASEEARLVAVEPQPNCRPRRPSADGGDVTEVHQQKSALGHSRTHYRVAASD